MYKKLNIWCYECQQYYNTASLLCRIIRNTAVSISGGDKSQQLFVHYTHGSTEEQAGALEKG